MQFPRPFKAHTPAVLALLAALSGVCATPAQAYVQPSALTPAVVCNAPDASETRPTRSWGAHNYTTKAIAVTCPINRPTNGSPVYGLMVYGNSYNASSDRASCLLVSVRKQDGYTLAMKFFSVGGYQAGMAGTWVFLEPWERSIDAVQEVRCTLPASDRSWLTAFEAFAG